MPAGHFCRINEAPSFGFPHTANISSPGWFLGSTGFHGMASLVVKVPWIAPAFAPAAGVAPVPRCCGKDCVAFAFITAPFFSQTLGFRPTRSDRKSRCKGDPMPAATQADFGSHTKDRNVFCDRSYSWLTAPDNLPLLGGADVTFSEALAGMTHVNSNIHHAVIPKNAHASLNSAALCGYPCGTP